MMPCLSFAVEWFGREASPIFATVEVPRANLIRLDVLRRRDIWRRPGAVLLLVAQHVQLARQQGVELRHGGRQEPGRQEAASTHHEDCRRNHGGTANIVTLVNMVT